MLPAYEQLEKVFSRVYRLSHFLALAGWDAQVNMPPKGAESRGEATGELESLIQEIIVSDKVRALLTEATAASDSLSEVQQANLLEMSRQYQLMACLPADFLEQKARLTTLAQVEWQRARAANDFAAFLPTLKKLVQTAREEAGYRAGDTGKSLYEALVDLYEPGMSLERLDAIFNEVKSWLPELLQEVVEAQKEHPSVTLKAPFHQKDQEALAKLCMELWQFDMEAGRLDASAHPFTGMTKEDCRITTRYNPENLEMSLYAVIHETGHGKYEQNCGPLEMRGQPVCNARSLGVHESQSLFAEKMMGRASAFIEFITPKLREIFGEQEGFTSDNMKRVIHHVEPGYIRVTADEVCYPLHVILRYEIERDLIEGRMEAEDVPRVWNEKMKKYLGVDTTGKDDKGCLQDVHWSFGGFGYFPTYSLGAMFAAQLMATIRKELGADTVNNCLRTGDLTPILEKQREKIWSQGCLHSTDDLMKRATGETLNPKYFREHLECRYLRRED